MQNRNTLINQLIFEKQRSDAIDFNKKLIAKENYELSVEKQRLEQQIPLQRQSLLLKQDILNSLVRLRRNNQVNGYVEQILILLNEFNHYGSEILRQCPDVQRQGPNVQRQGPDVVDLT